MSTSHQHPAGGHDAPRRSPPLVARTQAPPGRSAPAVVPGYVPARRPHTQADIGWPHTFGHPTPLGMETCAKCAAVRFRDHGQWLYVLPNGKRTRVQPAACESDLLETGAV